MSRSGAFLFKTTDGGSTWTNSGTGIASSDSAAGLGALAITPSNPQILYVMASRNWLYKSTNGGASWARINGINPGTPSEIDQLPFTQRLIVDPTDPNIVYAAVTKGVFFDTPGDVYKSTNGGITFARTGITTTSQFSVADMVMDPQDPNTLYLLVLQFSSYALYRTTNGGANWTQLSSSTGATDLAMAATPGGSTLYMAVTGGGIVESTDQGVTFTNANLGVRQVTQIGVSPSSPGTIYAATPGRPKDELGKIATDAFVAKLNPAGTAYDYITYLGGPGVDVGYGIAVDSNHNAYVTGKTIAGTFPTTPGAFQAQSPSTTQRLNAFVTKLNPTGSSLVYSTYLAGTSGGFTDVEDHGNAIAVDGLGRAAVTGVASSSNFPTTSNGFDTSFGGAGTYKAFVTVMNPDGSGLVYSTFLGGNGDEDLGRGIAFDSQGNLHVAGETSNEDPYRKGPTAFPTTSGAYQTGAGVPLVPAAFYAEINPNLSARRRSSIPPSSMARIPPIRRLPTPQRPMGWRLTVTAEPTWSVAPPMRLCRCGTALIRPTAAITRAATRSATGSWRSSTRPLRATRHSFTARSWAERAATRPMPLP